ncbi:hypothetical protein BDV97DRAFT_371568 [Delphinella strobiligena]|nr:hypothetical protein BDV97DRAFT_371568 [Delphinella strobiligena]
MDQVTEQDVSGRPKPQRLISRAVGRSGKPRPNQFVFINNAQTNGQVDKQSHSDIRSHAMTIVRQRQRVQGYNHSVESRVPKCTSGENSLAYGSESEHLNNKAISFGLSELGRTYWSVAERHIECVLPPIWDSGSLGRVTGTARSEELSAFARLYRDTLCRRKETCFKDPLHAYATLALSVGCSTWLFRSNSDPNIPIIFMDCALAALRKRCAQPTSIDEEVVLSIICLCKAESWRGDFDAALVHMRMVCYLFKKRNRAAFHPLLMDLALLADKHIALQLFQPPLLPLDFDPGPTIWPSLWQNKKHSAGIENAFNRLGSLLITERMRETLGLEISRIIRDLRDCILVALDVHDFSGPQPVEVAYAHWFFLRTTAILYRLLSIANEASSSQERSQKCVRVALIVWISFITADYASQAKRKWVQWLEMTLSACMNDTKSSDLLGAEVLLWIASLGASVASEGTESKHAFLYFLDLLTLRLGLQSEECIRHVLQGCFYLPGLQDDALRSLKRYITKLNE